MNHEHLIGYKSNASQEQAALGVQTAREQQPTPPLRSMSVVDLIAQAHCVLDQVANDVSILTDRLTPVLDFEMDSQGNNARELEKDASEPAAIETLSQLVTRLIALSSKVTYVTNRVRV